MALLYTHILLSYIYTYTYMYVYQTKQDIFFLTSAAHSQTYAQRDEELGS